MTDANFHTLMFSGLSNWRFSSWEKQSFQARFLIEWKRYSILYVVSTVRPCPSACGGSGRDARHEARKKAVVSCTDIPVSSRVVEAGEDNPFVVLILELDSNIISNLILETKLPKTPITDTKALAIADTDEELLDAFYRLALLIEKPEREQQIMAPIIIKEIYYRLLTGPLGNQLRLINTKGTRSNQIAQAISLIKYRYSEKLNMDEIAQSVNMAPSSFYRNFKKVTQVSPLQYQKQLRLNEAQRLMLSGEHNAESASYIVGYESPTQFSREYKKMFGNPPKTDVKNLVAV